MLYNLQGSMQLPAQPPSVVPPPAQVTHMVAIHIDEYNRVNNMLEYLIKETANLRENNLALVNRLSSQESCRGLVVGIVGK
jgi:hypothetical protein